MPLLVLAAAIALVKAVLSTAAGFVPSALAVSNVLVAVPRSVTAPSTSPWVASALSAIV